MIKSMARGVWLGTLIVITVVSIELWNQVIVAGVKAMGYEPMMIITLGVFLMVWLFKPNTQQLLGMLSWIVRRESHDRN